MLCDGLSMLGCFRKQRDGLGSVCRPADTDAYALRTGVLPLNQAGWLGLHVWNAYMQELLAIQQNGAKNIGFFGTRNMGYLHQQLIEILSYAMVITGNHIYTSGGLGTNAAVVRGALRAERPDLLTVILPQSLDKQPEELHELLGSVENLICMSENDDLSLLEASKYA